MRWNEAPALFPSVAMADQSIALECSKCHAVNFVAITASSKEFVCVSCGEPLDITSARADDRRRAKERESDGRG
jgi:hypothetical protein